MDHGRVYNGHGPHKDSSIRLRSSESLEMESLDGGSEPRRPAQYQDVEDDNYIANEDAAALLGTQSTLRNKKTQNERRSDESGWTLARSILVETAPTLLLTTIGLTFTGELLVQVGEWRALKRVDELYILIPILNNLKGNLEMNLSSRLSTSANIGELDLLSTRQALLLGNLTLLQVQALLVSSVAAFVSFLLSRIAPSSSGSPPKSSASKFMGRRRPPLKLPPQRPEKPPSGLREFAMMLCTAMMSASISGVILGSFMCSLILGCRRFSLNPDNITPPIASCLGDLLTLCIMGLVSSILIRTIDTVVPIFLFIILVIAAALAIFFTLRNEYVRQLIYSGWTPLFGAMCISAGTGLVLDHFVNEYQGFGLLAVVISGLPGAVGSVFVSRLSTSLHAAGDEFPKEVQKSRDPRTFVTIATLFLVAFPVQITFLAFLYATGWLRLPFLFLVFFILFFCFSVSASLLIAKSLTHFLWRRDLDPDTYALPILSSLVDLISQLLLVACYKISLAFGADVLNKPVA